MKLDRMWDIAGWRCIVSSKTQIERLKKEIQSKLYVRKINDYLEEPQESGYRSLHIYASRNKEDNYVIEIQIRTPEMHNWATLVEIIDLLYDKKIKEGALEPKFQKFLLLMSKVHHISILERREILDLVKELDIFNKLRSVFVNNYLAVRKQWVLLKKSGKNSFFIIEASKDTSPNIESFARYNEAEDTYFQKYIENTACNIVLTCLPEARFENIEIAYSNYILTMHTFLEDCCNLLEKVIIDSVEKGEVRVFHRYYSLYIATMLGHFDNVREEAGEISRTALPGQNDKELKSWKIDFENRFMKRAKGMNEFNAKVGEIYPKGGVKKQLFNTAMKLIKFKNRDKLKPTKQ